MMRKKAQEEFVGFALIIVIVAVILLIFLSFTLQQPQENVNSYEVESFLQTMLQYTSDCQNNYEFLPVQKLIVECLDQDDCLDGRTACDALNSTVQGLIEAGWGVGEDMPTKAYNIQIVTETEKVLELSKGNVTRNYKSAMQDFSRNPYSVQVLFKAYS